MTTIRHLVVIEIEHRQRFQALDEAVWVVVEDDTPIQQSVGVEDGLQFLHHLISLLTPLILHKRCHVPTRSMFSLQRTVILLYHQLCHIAHHLRITCHLMLIGKTLVQDEMVIALEGMTIDAGIRIAMIGNEPLQLHRRLRQRLDGECDILNQTRSAHRTRTTHTGEDTTADCPILAIDGRIFRKFSRNIQLELTQTLLDSLHLLQQLFMRDALRLRQDGRQVVIITWFHTWNLASIHILLILQIDRVIHRTQRHIVQHLRTLHHQILRTHRQILITSLQLLHRHHSLTTLLHRQEINHRRRLVRVVLQRAHRHLRQERQRTLTTHHRMGDDVERIVISHQRTQVQTRHILDTIFLTDARSQFLIGTHPITQRLNLLDHLWMTPTESRPALFIACIQHRSIGQHHASRHHHTVTVGMHTTVHARGIIDHNTTHHRATDRSWIGWEHTTIRFQDLIDTGTHDARLERDALMVVGKTIPLPMLTCHNQHRIRAALSTQRSASSTEGERQLIFLAELDNLRNLRFTITPKHHLRNLTIETGISTPSKGAQFVGINTVRRHELSEVG